MKYDIRCSDREIEILKKISLDLPELKRKRKKAQRLLYSAIAILGLLAIFQLVEQDIEGALTIFVLMLILYVLAVKIIIVQKKSLDKIYEKNKETLGVSELQHYELTDDYACITTTLGETKINWEAFIDYGEMNNDYYLMTKNNKTLLFRKEELTPEQDIELKKYMNKIKK